MKKDFRLIRNPGVYQGVGHLIVKDGGGSWVASKEESDLWEENEELRARVKALEERIKVIEAIRQP